MSRQIPLSASSSNSDLVTDYTASSARKTLFICYKFIPDPDTGTAPNSPTADIPLFGKALSPKGQESWNLLAPPSPDSTAVWSQCSYRHERVDADAEIRALISSNSGANGIVDIKNWNRGVLALDKTDVFISGSNIKMFWNGWKAPAAAWSSGTPSNFSPAGGTNPWKIGRSTSRFGSILYNPGLYAEACYWDEILPDNICEQLSNGTLSPLQVDAYRSNVKFYYTFKSDAPTLIIDLKNWKTGVNATATNTTSVPDHPTITYPNPVPDPGGITPPDPASTVEIQLNGNSITDSFKISGVISLASKLNPPKTLSYSRQVIPGSPLETQMNQCLDADSTNDGFVEAQGNTKEMIQGAKVPTFIPEIWNFQPFDRKIEGMTTTQDPEAAPGVFLPIGDHPVIKYMLDWGRPPKIATDRVKDVQCFIYQRWRRKNVDGAVGDLTAANFKSEADVDYVESSGNYDYERRNFFTKLTDVIRADTALNAGMSKKFLMVPVYNVWYRVNEDIIAGHPIWTGQYAFVSAWYLLRNPQQDLSNASYKKDGIHSSNLGSYIAGLTHLACWLGVDVRTLPYDIPTVYTDLSADSPNDRPITQAMDTYLKAIVHSEVTKIPEYTGYSGGSGPIPDEVPVNTWMPNPASYTHPDPGYDGDNVKGDPYAYPPLPGVTIPKTPLPTDGLTYPTYPMYPEPKVK